MIPPTLDKSVSTAQLHPIPIGFKLHRFSRVFSSRYSRDEVWDWLNDTRTFTQHQVWPYRVEFLSPEPDVNANFSEGVFTTHHGPLMNFAGILTQVDYLKYRDLHYMYGSYFLTIRWLRPTRLQFWLEENGEGTEVTLQLDAYVNPLLYTLWDRVQSFFWGRFGRWMNRSIGKRVHFR